MCDKVSVTFGSRGQGLTGKAHIPACLGLTQSRSHLQLATLQSHTLKAHWIWGLFVEAACILLGFQR